MYETHTSECLATAVSVCPRAHARTLLKQELEKEETGAAACACVLTADECRQVLGRVLVRACVCVCVCSYHSLTADECRQILGRARARARVCVCVCVSLTANECRQVV